MSDDPFTDPIQARKKAMDYLARREHSAVELCKKLEKFGFDASTAADAIAQLTRDGLQSEQRFIDAFLQSRIHQGKGPTKIRADLRERGIADHLIDNVLAAAAENWFELARKVRCKKFGADRPVDFRQKARQMRFLQARGFESDHIQYAVSEDQDKA